MKMTTLPYVMDADDLYELAEALVKQREYKGAIRNFESAAANGSKEAQEYIDKIRSHRLKTATHDSDVSAVIPDIDFLCSAYHELEKEKENK